jgi:son of sevenless-like protein
MSDGNPDTRASATSPDMQLINLDKYIKLGKIALDFKRYQQPYHFHELEVVQTFLRRTLAERGSSSLDALYRKSRECGTDWRNLGPSLRTVMLEPRQRSEKISSAVEKPGWLGTRI